ncbi:AraC family transcriptional regulator [Larsenimonas salina]|uniref:AraC family transcriptional regulator n=1 Tax=Larsenimonas salina TaxID=1295565 RepID=UPI002073AC84|nr:AraC family transcriptional regulator [Larsenimonas salina]MCM5704247.1 AraC family transcriptional regulator [Larsenimonas salina]
MAPMSADWFRLAPTERLERLEARFQGHAFSPHRHDTYAIGITLEGVQSFHYRRSHCHSLPGTVIVLHPDELHDGHAGCSEGFLYRMLYVKPALMQAMLKGRPLPFLTGGLSTDARLVRTVRTLLLDMDHAPGALEETDGLFDLTMALADNSDAGPTKGRHALDHLAAERARQYLDDNLLHGATLETLEMISGRERWSLSRDFRTLYGTSPYRYLTLRRLDDTKRRIAGGASLTDAALTSGFADQSHMSRAFKRAYGVTPARWRALTTAPR